MLRRQSAGNRFHESLNAQRPRYQCYQKPSSNSKYPAVAVAAAAAVAAHFTAARTAADAMALKQQNLAGS
jgi:hypothetical protein